MPWLDLIGWFGSALLIVSVMQARLLRFRVLNLFACVVLTGFNAALLIWPMVAMNVALSLINLWHIRKLLAARHDEQSFEVLEVGPDDEYLRHVMRVHGADILKFQPDLVWDGSATGTLGVPGAAWRRDGGDGAAPRRRRRSGQGAAGLRHSEVPRLLPR